MIPTYRVSHLSAYHRWKTKEEYATNQLFQDIYSTESTEAQARGTAFHKALETAAEGEYDTVTAMGYTFAFTCSAEITLPKTREQRRSKNYGGIIVSGQCDGIEGKRILDHKTVQQFDAQYHLDGWQHRFYLDIFGADQFDWHIWEVGQINPASLTKIIGPEPNGEHAKDDYYEAVDQLAQSEDVYEVYAHHLLTQYRYPKLEDDCRQLALEFRDFAARLGWNGKAA